MMSNDNFGTVYQPSLESIIVHLSKGFQTFTLFVERLETSFNQRHDLSYIETELLPSVENAKKTFDEMKTCADEILKKVNKDFEECVNDLQNQNEKIHQIDGDLARLKTQLKTKEGDVRDADRQYKQKTKESSDARDALSAAKRKLERAEKDRENVFICGAVGFCAAFVFPPAAAIGVGCGVAGITGFREAVNKCENNVDIALDVELSSKESLKKAKDTMDQFKTQLSDLAIKKGLTLTKHKTNQRRKMKIQRKQKSIVELNESIKEFYRKICHFHGRFQVLLLETNGGYSIAMLKSPTLDVCTSLASLLECPEVGDSCSGSQLGSMKQQLQQIEAVRWPAMPEILDSDCV